ncbi:MAG: cation:proton antiporter [Caldilineaceae bacterium]
MTQLTIFLASFLIVALASQRIGQFFARVHLPLISGFLFAGILAGPYVLGLISTELTENLRFVDEISLAVIAFAAGSELYLKELRSRMKSIAWVTVGNILVIPAVTIVAMLLLAETIPFMRDLPRGATLGVALVTGSILVARSPSSAIAIVNELRASGPFTKTVLGVTMLTDVAVIVLFAISSSIADALFTHLALSIDFVALLLLEFGLEVGIGYVLGLLLADVLSHHLPRGIKIAAVLLVGYAVFMLAALVRDMSMRFLPAEIFLEPLLICMIASFWVTNYTDVRTEFLKLLHDIGPTVYIAFFTLTGASLALDVLARTWPIALALFGVRIVGIFAGSFLGGTVAGEPRRHNLLSWMAYITQAGVGLGLAKEVAVEFPEWGSAFATTVISAIVLSQLAGPPFFKWVINAVGEARTRAATPPDDAVQRALIFGLEAQSIAPWRLLQAQGWQCRSRHVTHASWRTWTPSTSPFGPFPT